MERYQKEYAAWCAARGLDAQTRAALIEETPVCRIGTPEDVLAAVRFFLSDEASFVTGQCLGVDGGFAV